MYKATRNGKEYEGKNVAQLVRAIGGVGGGKIKPFDIYQSQWARYSNSTKLRLAVEAGRITPTAGPAWFLDLEEEEIEEEDNEEDAQYEVSPEAAAYAVAQRWAVRWGKYNDIDVIYKMLKNEVVPQFSSRAHESQWKKAQAEFNAILY